MTIHFDSGMTGVRQLTRQLRLGKYTPIGSYPIFFITARGGALSYDGIKENIWLVLRAVRDGEAGLSPVACDINYENTTLQCELTEESIEAAYL